MECIDRIRTNIDEVNVLIDYAKSNIGELSKYQLFNKVAIVLLSTKLEVFLEEFIEEHIQRQLKNHTTKTFPQNLKEKYFDNGIILIYERKKRSEKEKLFNSLITLYSNEDMLISEIKNICPSNKFNYGKHGQKEIESLFSNHGLENLIKKRPIQECLNQMNSLIAIRNNVIHQDATPSLTHNTIEAHIKNILDFVTIVENDITENQQLYYNQT